MEYTDIGHEVTYRVWVWSFGDKLECHKTHKGHDGVKSGVHDIASGRVDPKTKVGSIVFTPKLDDRSKTKVIESLLLRFPGVKFYIFGESHNRPVLSLSEYYENI